MPSATRLPRQYEGGKKSRWWDSVAFARTVQGGFRSLSCVLCLQLVLFLWILCRLFISFEDVCTACTWPRMRRPLQEKLLSYSEQCCFTATVCSRKSFRTGFFPAALQVFYFGPGAYFIPLAALPEATQTVWKNTRTLQLPWQCPDSDFEKFSIPETLGHKTIDPMGTFFLFT